MTHSDPKDRSSPRRGPHRGRAAGARDRRMRRRQEGGGHRRPGHERRGDYTDFFVIPSGANTRQTKAIADEIQGRLRTRRARRAWRAIGRASGSFSTSSTSSSTSSLRPHASSTASRRSGETCRSRARFGGLSVVVLNVLSMHSRTWEDARAQGHLGGDRRDSGVGVGGRRGAASGARRQRRQRAGAARAHQPVRAQHGLARLALQPSSLPARRARTASTWCSRTTSRTRR